ncbi:MAG: CoB--CoM heterodisulfide reductase iron-sulfur subunit B family protein [Planctomycetota bacterium]|nr:CoB--CoM heterodisulfide reductase iron-sulfur subunit B family protein [Planctomycetota bacterium]
MPETAMNYYPGCTLKTKAKQLDAGARRTASALGVEMRELPEWQCCGAVYPLAEDEISGRLSAVRTLSAALENGGGLVTVCSACHHVLKRVNADMADNELIRRRANNYLALKKAYAGETRVVHYLEWLRDDIGFEEVKKHVARPLDGLKVAPYYGCLLLRPSDVMRFDRPDNPSIMEKLVEALGGVAVPFSRRSRCCGGYVALDDRESAQAMTESVLSSAVKAGAEVVISACPLCMYNLKNGAGENKLPVRYFTELLEEAFGLADAAKE